MWVIREIMLKKLKSLFSSDNDKFKVGEFRDGKWYFQGTFTLPDGRKYVREWKDYFPWNGTEYDKYGKVLKTVSNGVWK